MGYAGAANLEDLRTRTRLMRITNAGFIESHPHDADRQGSTQLSSAAIGILAERG